MLQIFRFCLTALVLSLVQQAYAQRYLRTAEKEYELGNFAEAIPGFERYLEKMPGAIPQGGQLAYSLRMAGQTEAASVAYEAAARSSPANPDYAYNYAITLMELGDYAKSAAQLAQAARLGHPEAAAAQERLAFAVANQAVSRAGGWRVTNEFVNGPGDDFGATPFGKRVVYAAQRNGQPTKLQISGLDERSFLQIPTPLHNTLTEQSGDAPLAYSPSGELLAYTRNNFVPGERFLPEAGWELSLILAAPTEDGDFRQGKPFVHNGPGYSSGFPSFSKDGRKLYFASDRPGGYGGYDLYVSERNNSGWGEPINLGSKVNSPGNEISPSLVEGALFFASDYLPGYGGMDIFRADAMGAVYTNVVNLGSTVNSPLDDFGFVLDRDGRFAYFTSNRYGGKGELDIYRAVRDVKAFEIAVLDAETGEPVPNALIDFASCQESSSLTGPDGVYLFRASPNLECEPVVRKSGYEARTFNLVASSLKNKERVEVRIQPVKSLSTYSGSVVDGRSGKPLENVSIRARSRGASFATSATSDAAGKYELSLKPQGSYTIQYELPGMTGLDREFATTPTDTVFDLGRFALFSTVDPDTAVEERVTEPVTLPDSALAGSTGAASPATPRGPVLQPSTVDSGFSVQVAAIDANEDDISEYEIRLGSLGEVYARRGGAMMRIRVGPFGYTQGTEAVSEIREMGFTDAFLINEPGGEVLRMGTGVPVTSTADEQPPAAGRPRPPSPTESAERVPEDRSDRFFVRLATYRDFSSFDPLTTEELGPITTRTSGNFTIVLLEGFANEAEAGASIPAAQEAGFRDAHVVAETPGGKLRRVRGK